MMNQNKKRTIIHELGHYTARRLNLKKGKGGGVNQIWIKEKRKNDIIEFEGGTVPIPPKNYIDDGSIKDKPEFIATVSYGCIFQILFESKSPVENFEECFCHQNLRNYSVRAHGTDDFDKLEHHFSERIKDDVIKHIKFSYLPILIKNRDHIDQLFEINFDDYLFQRDSLQELNLNRLQADIDNFLITHSQYYYNYLKTLQNII